MPRKRGDTPPIGADTRKKESGLEVEDFELQGGQLNDLETYIAQKYSPKVKSSKIKIPLVDVRGQAALTLYSTACWDDKDFDLGAFSQLQSRPRHGPPGPSGNGEKVPTAVGWIFLMCGGTLSLRLDESEECRVGGERTAGDVELLKSGVAGFSGVGVIASSSEIPSIPAVAHGSAMRRHVVLAGSPRGSALSDAVYRTQRGAEKGEEIGGEWENVLAESPVAAHAVVAQGGQQ
ncbi:hypothetical protein C8F04DRAFT_1185409 [Mycena alexandri]|uniref:Uncharacterized protein n=1 Tax=Mycena alexandri TaxID=1745969 RepID=A0AAD6SQ50_9AGAR|nr:hypothetical protein C8F04DRAFT_1185409 [Mycena alexandri]